MGQFQPAISLTLASSQSERFLIAALPPAHSRHWIPRHKQAVVRAVHAGILSMREAASRYELSMEEFISWENEFAQKQMAKTERDEAYS